MVRVGEMTVLQAARVVVVVVVDGDLEKMHRFMRAVVFRLSRREGRWRRRTRLRQAGRRVVGIIGALGSV